MVANPLPAFDLDDVQSVEVPSLGRASVSIEPGTYVFTLDRMVPNEEMAIVDGSDGDIGSSWIVSTEPSFATAVEVKSGTLSVINLAAFVRRLFWAPVP